MCLWTPSSSAHTLNPSLTLNSPLFHRSPPQIRHHTPVPTTRRSPPCRPFLSLYILTPPRHLLQGRALKEVDSAFFERTQAAEAARDIETAAGVRLQKVWRGRTVRKHIQYWTGHASLLERCTRGYLGRLHALRMRMARDEERQRAYFDAHVTIIQLRFRGASSSRTLTRHTSTA